MKEKRKYYTEIFAFDDKKIIYIIQKNAHENMVDIQTGKIINTKFEMNKSIKMAEKMTGIKIDNLKCFYKYECFSTADNNSRISQQYILSSQECFKEFDYLIKATSKIKQKIKEYFQTLENDNDMNKYYSSDNLVIIIECDDEQNILKIELI